VSTIGKQQIKQTNSGLGAAVEVDAIGEQQVPWGLHTYSTMVYGVVVLLRVTLRLYCPNVSSYRLEQLSEKQKHSPSISNVIPTHTQVTL